MNSFTQADNHQDNAVPPVQVVHRRIAEQLPSCFDELINTHLLPAMNGVNAAIDCDNIICSNNRAHTTLTHLMTSIEALVQLMVHPVNGGR